LTRGLHTGFSRNRKPVAPRSAGKLSRSIVELKRSGVAVDLSSFYIAAAASDAKAPKVTLKKFS
jgi:hypothetical protein